MKHYLTIALTALLLTGCGKDKKENNEIETEPVVALAFETKEYKATSSLPCKEHCPKVAIEVTEATGPQPTADSINKKIFNTVREIIYYGEKPYDATNYDELTASFIQSYEELKKEFPKEMLGWEGTIAATVTHRTDSLLNITLNHFTYTGGAHGYAGTRSLLFDPKTGHALAYRDIFNDVKSFTDYAEKSFRKKFKIEAMQSINSTGFMFENETFVLPNAIFFQEDGLLLYYNTYEVSSYAEGAKELLLPYKEIEQYLKVK
ncbi:DUF3298 domain-containing protein [Flavobacterium arcticum]|uniref:DUF3298 domain-containing protein n=1 Tax=Flavobacterium arcticum TaxID=1784713 RepID=A0A345HBG4_9FLAO|nr:DUF3298 and DUF4163 domain-containing protein [Flavobacterium arcticum]AXG73924.1 DUF3298 domain-containing protein [Flavobacterium arcticum]KAF2508900.1 DUF3298 and DUF4163 domain-containing protein [Flavobacterium arcticum]